MTKNSVSKLLNPPVPGYPSMPQANYTGMAVHGQATKRPKFAPNAQRSVITVPSVIYFYFRGGARIGFRPRVVQNNPNMIGPRPPAPSQKNAPTTENPF